MKFLDAVEINPQVDLKKGVSYPFVEMSEVSTARDIQSYTLKPFASGVRFEKGDTIVARITPCLQNGKGFYCQHIEKGFGSTEFLVFRAKSGKADSLFLYYYMKTTIIREKMIKSMKGADGRQRVNNAVFQQLEFPDYDLARQKHIASILSAYDDLIENNQKQIKLLEEAAQRLYKEWFVDLRFPGYEKTRIVEGVPEGWKSSVLGELVEFNPKVILNKHREKQSVPMAALSTSSMVLDMTVFESTFSNSGSNFQNNDTLLARITPCLENGKTAFVSGIDSPEGAVGSTEFIVMRSLKLNPYMVYLLARTFDFRKYAINCMTGSDGRQRVQVDKLRLFPFVEPSHIIGELFSETVAPIFTQIQTKHEMNYHLSIVRNRMLATLMKNPAEKS